MIEDEFNISTKKSLQKKRYKEDRSLKCNAVFSKARKLLLADTSLLELTWIDFENLISELLRMDGWKVYQTRATKDGGIDIIATNARLIGFFKMIFQVKRYKRSRPVGVNVIRELGFLINKTGAPRGIVITTSRFTKGALKLMEENIFTMSCFDYEDIEKWILENNGGSEEQDIKDDLPF